MGMLQELLWTGPITMYDKSLHIGLYSHCELYGGSSHISPGHIYILSADYHILNYLII